MDSQKRILVFVGPSGSGKTTVGNELTRRGIPKLVTTTTRNPREGEKDGTDYYFRTPQDMEKEPFVEQTIYNGNIYGLTVKEVENALEYQHIVHVSLDQNGAEAMKQKYPEQTRIIYFDVPEEKMIQRMKKRGDSNEKIQERLNFGRQSGEYRAPEDTHLMVENDDVNHTADMILNAFHIQKNASAAQK